jgi:hypothetical protein
MVPFSRESAPGLLYIFQSMSLFCLFPAITKQLLVHDEHAVCHVPQLQGGAFLAEKGNLHVFAVVLDCLDSAHKVIIPGDEYGGIIIVFKAVSYHIRGKLNVHAFFKGGVVGQLLIPGAPASFPDRGLTPRC